MWIAGGKRGRGELSRQDFQLGSAAQELRHEPHVRVGVDARILLACGGVTRRPAYPTPVPHNQQRRAVIFYL